MHAHLKIPAAQVTEAMWLFIFRWTDSFKKNTLEAHRTEPVAQVELCQSCQRSLCVRCALIWYINSHIRPAKATALTASDGCCTSVNKLYYLCSTHASHYGIIK
jgi:hypothetical protein